MFHVLIKCLLSLVTNSFLVGAEDKVRDFQDMALGTQNIQRSAGVFCFMKGVEVLSDVFQVVLDIALRCIPLFVNSYH